MTNIKVGDTVRIVYDRRSSDEHNYTGEIGTYDGDFLAMVALFIDGQQVSEELPLDAYMDGRLRVSKGGDPVKQNFPLWNELHARPRQYAVAYETPRFTMKDGEVLYGWQCWWLKYNPMILQTLAMEQAYLARVVNAYNRFQRWLQQYYQSGTLQKQ